MFDIGFAELVLLAVVGLLVLGPERLPEAARTLGVMLGRVRRSFQSLRDEVQRELRAEELRQKLDEERRKLGLEEFGRSIEEGARKVQNQLDQDVTRSEATAAESPKSGSSKDVA